MPLVEFLKQVLPNDGYKCWVQIDQHKKVTQGFTLSFDELAIKIQEIDARGCDAYFACSTFQTAQSRRAGNVLCANTFRMDIDAGEGKPYVDADAAADACDEFCRRTGLPFPGVVRSGGGIHAYWVLDAVLPRDAWCAIAQRLKLLTEAYAFHADPTTTADVSRILRAPGTKNYKIPGHPRVVAIEDEAYFAPVSCEQFIETLIKNLQETSAKSINTPSKEYAMQGILPSAAPAVTAGGVGGNGFLPAPTPNAALLGGMAVSKAFDHTKGVAQGCRGSTCLTYAGQMVARGQSFDDVLARCMAWNQLCMPPQEEKEVRRIIASAFNMHKQKHAPVLAPQEVEGLGELPHGYHWGPQQQLMVNIKNKDEVEAHMLSPYPVYLKAIMNVENGARENSYLFRQFNVNGGWHEFTISAEGINGQNWYASWMKRGGSLYSGMDKYFSSYVRKAEIMLRAKPELTRYSQFGWKDDDSAFLVGDALLVNGQPQKAYGTEKLEPLMRTMAVPKAGSLDEWTRAADKFFAPGMEAHGFALLCSFAAPLMKFCAGMADGGSILSLVSEDSGKGKTPIAEAIASVWGDLDSTVVTGNFTDNRRIDSVVRHCNLPQVQEEMTMSDPSVAAESVKKFTNGCDRGRLNMKGEGKEIPERFQTILVSISNISMYEMVSQVDAAAARRVLEIDIQRPDSEAFSNLGGITREMMRNRAYAGRRFAQIITSPGLPQYLKEHLTGLTADRPGSVIMRYRERLHTSAEHRFLVWLLSAVDVAARLVTHYGILHFDVERIMQWACLQTAEKVTENTPDDAAGKLNRFLSEHISTCLVVPRAYDPKLAPMVPISRPQHQMFMRWEIKERRLFISTEPLRIWCQRRRIGFVQLGRMLVAEGIIIERNKLVTLGAGTDIPSARSYCWEIDMTHKAMAGTVTVNNVLELVAKTQAV